MGLVAFDFAHPRLVLALGDSFNMLLRFDRGGIAAGGWWRLLTAHIVHLDLHHLI